MRIWLIYFGGIVSVPLDKGLQTGELEDSLIRSEVSAIIFDKGLEASILEIKNNNKTKIEHFICTEKNLDFLYFYDLLSEGK